MHTRYAVRASLVLMLVCATQLLDARRATAQDFALQLRNGLVTLVARDATVTQILDRWAQVGGTTIVNREKIHGAPITLQLVDVPERTALAILLRDVGGYILAERLDARQGASVIDRVLILPTSTVPVRSSPAQALVAPSQAFVGVPDTGNLSTASLTPSEVPETSGLQFIGSGRTGQDVGVRPGPLDRGSAVPGYNPALTLGNAGNVGRQPDVPAGGNGRPGSSSIIRPTNPSGINNGGLRPGEVTTMPPQPEIVPSPSGEVYRPTPKQ